MLSALATAGFAPVDDIETALRQICAAGLLEDYPRSRHGAPFIATNASQSHMVLVRDDGRECADPSLAEVEFVEFRLSLEVSPESPTLAAVPRAVVGSTCQVRKREWLQADLTGLSPNGKLLSRETIQAACRECYDDSVRSAIRSNKLAGGEVTTALRQGLWLEHLVADVCLQFTEDVWAGQMADLFEVDVIANVDGQILLFECKDSSLGQNDFFIALKKAHAINADLLVLIATKPFHSNVVRAIEGELDRADEDGDSVIIPILRLDRSDAAGIADSLGAFLRELRWLTVFHWLYFDHTSAAAPHFFNVKPLPLDA